MPGASASLDIMALYSYFYSYCCHHQLRITLCLELCYCIFGPRALHRQMHSSYSVSHNCIVAG